MIMLNRSQKIFGLLNRFNCHKCRCYCKAVGLTSLKSKLKNGPDLKQFIAGTQTDIETSRPNIPYLMERSDISAPQKVFFDIYGCQMNLNDTEIVWSILKEEGFEKTENEDDADIFLVMTCAIREGAETKIWHRLDHLRGFKNRRAVSKYKNPVKIGILGCMAERLKEKLIEKEKSVDLGKCLAPIFTQVIYYSFNLMI